MRVLRRRRRPPSAAGGPPPSHWEAQERAWRAGISEHGWLVLTVPGGPEGQPGFQFTAGLTGHDLPEMIVYGLGPELGTHVLNAVAERLVGGERFADGETLPDLLAAGDYRVQLRDVTWLQDPLGAAYAVYGEERVRVRQLIVPDVDDRLPWEDGHAFPDLQPVLFVPPNGRGPRRAGPPESQDGHVAPEDWDLPQDPHLGVVTTTHVLDAGLPVLLVVHEDEGDWQVLDGVHEPAVEDGRVACLHHLVEADRTLEEVLRTLPPGRLAERDVLGGRWRLGAYDGGG